MKKNKEIIHEYTVDPYEGALSLCLIAPKGYVFSRMERKGTKAKVWYTKKDKKTC
jgi:hypothetical protein